MKSAPQSSNWFAALIVLLNTTAFAQESKLTEREWKMNNIQEVKGDAK